MKKLLCGVVGLGVLFDLGCGGTMDLTKLDENGGAESMSGASPGIAGGIQQSDAGGPSSSAGQCTAAGSPGVGGESLGGSDGVAGYQGVAGSPGGGGYYGVAGSPAGGGYYGVAGSPGEGGYFGVAGSPGVGGYPPGVGGLPGAAGYQGVAGSDGQAAIACVEDADCVECSAQTDPAISGCYVPCCASTAMNTTTCSHHWQTFFATCPNVACAAMCTEKPQPKCVNNQCVHGTASP